MFQTPETPADGLGERPSQGGAAFLQGVGHLIHATAKVERQKVDRARVLCVELRREDEAPLYLLYL